MSNPIGCGEIPASKNDCCPNPLPWMLHAQVKAIANCTCGDGVLIPLGGGSGGYSGSQGFCDGEITLNLACETPGDCWGFELTVTFSNLGTCTKIERVVPDAVCDCCAVSMRFLVQGLNPDCCGNDTEIPDLEIWVSD